MLFNSFIFLIFLLVILPIFYLLPYKKYKNLFLVISSYIFYGYWDWRFCILLFISTLIDYIVGKKIFTQKNPQIRKKILFISLFSNLGILFIFKYFNFFISSFESLTTIFGGNLDFLHVKIILPVGISFYTFQTLSYTIDIYRKKIKPTSNFIDFALFVSFFPQLVAGPIERAKYLLPQLSKKMSPDIQQVKTGITLIVIGLFKKVIIGDTSGKFVDHIFGNLELYKSIEVLSALILFSIQIYADFSGYSSIARGTAKLLGVDLIRNFNQPYLSRNITEFWRRWHISLSMWLKDYLYITLGGNKKGTNRTYINLSITMLLGGLWHGANWNFIIWGGLHGFYLSLHKLFLGTKKVNDSNITKVSFKDALNIFSTYILVLFTWLFFRSTSLESTLNFFNKIIHWESSEYFFLFISIVLTYLVIVILIDIFEYKTNSHSFILKINNNAIVSGLLFGLFLITFMYMLQSNSMPFLYFQF